MHWKSWPYGKRAGVILGGIGSFPVFLMLLGLFTSGITGGITGSGGGPFWAATIYALLFTTPIAIVFYWVGSIIGWLYGKFKNRKQII